MKPYFTIFLVILLSACATRGLKLIKSGEAPFRITYNYGRQLTDNELDSLQESKPSYRGAGEDDRFYALLVKKGFAIDGNLDTSGLNMRVLTAVSPIVHLSSFEFRVEHDIPAEHDFLYVKKNKEICKLDLGYSLLGDRLVTLYDIDDDGNPELILLEKYYIMGGDNFDLKYYELE